MVIHRQKPITISKQNICLDKGYDFPKVYELLQEYGYTIHIPKKRVNNYIGYQNIEQNTGLLKERIHGCTGSDGY
jgi:hypothetical protein